MSYGNMATGQPFEHETTRRLKAQQAQQQAQMQQQDAMGWERGREMHERGLQQQEQQRRQYDSQTARDIGGQKYGVLAGLTNQMGQSGPGMGFPSGGFVINSSSRRPQTGRRM